MNKNKEFYQCDICGNLVSVLKSGHGTLKCCNEEMIHLKPKTGDPASEKHIPYCSAEDDTIRVRTGKNPHPMVKAHFIGFVEAQQDNLVCRKFMEPGQKPELVFTILKKDVKLRSYCLIHGIFEADYKQG